jgi:RNA polymerase primary sigma factor
VEPNTSTLRESTAAPSVGRSGPVPPAEQLTAQQERDLVIAAEAGGRDARREFVSAFLPSIAGVAHRFPHGSGVERQELIQEGVAGLLFAAQRYDPGLDTPFWAYASFWVRKAMQELVAELSRPVAFSDRAARGLAQIRTARREHLQAHGTEPTTEDLALGTGLTAEQVDSLQAIERTPTATVGDAIVDPLAEQEYERVLDEMEFGEVRDFAEQLGDRERAVIRAHYGLGQPPRTLTQIGSELGLTAERARQIEVGALSKLRESLA